MREILAFKGRIKPLIEISLRFMQSNHELFVMQDTIQQLQMAIYFIQEAAEFVYQAGKRDDIEHEGERLHNSESPAILLPTDQLVFLFETCNELSKDIYKFLTDVPVGQLAQIWLTNALTKITEAKFSIVITSIQYEKLQGARGTNTLER